MNNPLHKRKYDSDLSRAMNAVLLELTDVLGAYQDSLVVSGGMAMRLLLGETMAPLSDEDGAEEEEPFARETKDVDLVLNLVRIGHDFDDQIDTIGEALMRSEYQQETRRQFWIRFVSLPGFSAPIKVIVEFLAPTPHDAGLDHSLPDKIAQQQEIQPAVLDGIALALLQPQQIRLTGETLSGAVSDTTVQVVHPAMLILIKAIAFDDRLKKHDRHPENGHSDHAAKHAYDISKLVLRYPGGVSALVQWLTPPYITSPGPEQATVDRALESLRTHFTDQDGAGVRLMAQEGEYQYEEEKKEIAQRGTVARVGRLLQRLDEQAESLY